MVSNVAFRGFLVVTWRRLNTVSGIVYEIPVQVRGPILLQEFLNYTLRVAVSALSEMLVADLPFCVEDVERWPVLIVKVLPYPVIAVHYDWIGNAQVFQGCIYIRLLLLEGELGGVHADHDQSRLLIFRRPTLYVRQGSQTIDARISPEIDQHNLSAQGLTAYRGGVEPGNTAIEAGHGAIISKE